MDGEAYERTIEKLLNSDDVSPIMKKVLEKELHRAKGKPEKSLKHKSEVSSNSTSTPTTTSTTDSNSDNNKNSEDTGGMEREMKSEMDEEKKIFDQADTAIKNMEGWLSENEKTSPLLRSLIEYTLKKLKRIRARAQENMDEIQKEMNELHTQEQSSKDTSSPSPRNNHNNNNNNNNDDNDEQTKKTEEREKEKTNEENKQGSDFMNSLKPPKNSSESLGVSCNSCLF